MAPDVPETVSSGELEVGSDIRSGAGVFTELGADGSEGTKRGVWLCEGRAVTLVPGA